MQWNNTRTHFGAVAKFFHWTSAAAFIGAYIVVYYVIWFMDDTLPESFPVLNIHWALGLLVGSLVIPRLLWRLFSLQPDEVAGSKTEHQLAHFAHWALYALMIALPVTGYIGTDAPTDYGMFAVPSFRETSLFSWLSTSFGFDWEQFEAPVDVIHHFIGKWIAWVVVTLHIAAALYHHYIRRDQVLTRMLPQ